MIADSPVFPIQRFTPEPDAVYPVDTIAHLAGVPRHTVLLCCRHHLIAPHEDPEYGGYRFSVGTIRILQRADYLHRECGINFTGVRIILGLMDEVEELRAQVREY
jgi:hypothetical protein